MVVRDVERADIEFISKVRCWALGAEQPGVPDLRVPPD
jgi:hypothetical protein